MKTQAQIVQRISEVSESDFFGVMTTDLIGYLDYEHARDFLNPEVTDSEWGRREVKSPEKNIEEYLPFAWEKANNCRGLSAARSLQHISTWLWLMGKDNIVEQHFDNYEHYGKEQLVLASEIVGFDWKSHDNGEWVNDESSPSLSKSLVESISNEYVGYAKSA